MMRTPFRQLVPNEGTIIDAGRWREAHEYHEFNHQTHLLSMHDFGIVEGLKVHADSPQSSAIIVEPGIAVDEHGRLLINKDRQRLEVQTQRGRIYVTIRYDVTFIYDHVDPASKDKSPPTANTVQYRTDANRIEIALNVPESAYLELARIACSGNGETIGNAKYPFKPTMNEIDLSHRKQFGPKPIDKLDIVAAAIDPWDDTALTHSHGAVNLAHLIDETTRYNSGSSVARLDEPGSLEAARLVLLTAAAPFMLSDEAVSTLRQFVDRGGTVYIERCSNAPNPAGIEEMRQSFRDLAERLGRTVEITAAGHPVLSSHHFFAALPRGANAETEPTLIEAVSGLLYSDADYGCLWNGMRMGQPGSHEAIRTALEFGTNIAVYASKHARLHGGG
jgi:hypothetical protein